jgi:hypothetical protein
MDATWLQGDVRKLEIVEHLRATDHLTGALSDFRVDDRECDVSFKGPGYSADVFIDRATGRYDLTEDRMGFGNVINDLHKGRDAGAGWKWIIDLSAALLVFVSFTGLVLLWFVHKHRTAGFLSAAAGMLMAYLAYVALVR